MKKLFWWALAIVALDVLVYQACCMVTLGNDTFSIALAAAASAATIAVAATAATIAFAITFAKKKNLPYWRVITVFLGEAGAILGWILLGQHSLPLAVASLAVGVGVMALAAFVCVLLEPENKATAVGQ